MKIACHSCAAHYAIADETIAGGVFEFTCKRCGTPLVLRGDTTNTTPALRDERKETSLLFSLRDLSGARPAPSQPVSSTARGQNSGLLDMRGLARAYAEGADAAGTAVPVPLVKEDGSQPIPLPFRDNMHTPLALALPRLPTAQEPRGKLIWALAGLAGVMALAAIVLGVVVMERRTHSDHAASQASPVEDSAPASDLVASASPDRATSEEPPVTPPSADEPELVSSQEAGLSVKPRSTAPVTTSEPAASHVAVATSEPATTTRRTRDSRPTSSTQTERRETVTRTEPAASTPTPLASQPATTESGTCNLDELACVLANYEPACCVRYKKAGQRTSHASTSRQASLPPRPSRADIQSGISAIRSQVVACGASSSARGKVTVAMKVTGDGKVERATVKESPDEALGRCVARAMRAARFAESQNGTSFDYPFVF